MAEAILNKIGGGRFRAYSAGSQPKGKVHHETTGLLQSLGYDTAGLHSKSWDEFAGPNAPPLDAVITVCNNAAAEVCPVMPGEPAKAHWDIPDPAAVTGDPEQVRAAFRDAYDMLAGRVRALVNSN